MDTFLAVRRGKDDWVVAHRADVDKDGKLKKDRTPISQNHRLHRDAAVAKEKLEEKFGDGVC